jgi:glucosamine-6-phosphate deaminase
VDIQVFQTPDEVARALARRVSRALDDKPDLVLGLPAGGTFAGAYADLVARCAQGDADFSLSTAFVLDEFVGLPADHPARFRAFLQQHLLAGVNIDRARVHALDGAAAGLDAECRRYEAAIAHAGGVDLQLLGIGANGHIGFNEPGESLVARTHRAMLAESTRHANAARFGGDVAAVPHEALTMGMGTILNAAALVLAATGGHKAVAVARAVAGPVTTRLPASFLQLHAHVELYLDWAAASRLPPHELAGGQA